MQGEEAEEGHEKCTTQVWPEHLQHVLGNIWKHFHCTHSMCLETFGNTSIVRMQKKTATSHYFVNLSGEWRVHRNGRNWSASEVSVPVKTLRKTFNTKSVGRGLVACDLKLKPSRY